MTQPGYGQILHPYAGKSFNKIYRTSSQLHTWGLFWCLWSKTRLSSNQEGIVVWEPGWVKQPPAAREVGEREKEIGAGKAANSLDAGEMLGCHLIPGSLLQGWLESGKAWQSSGFLFQRKWVGMGQDIVQVLLQGQKWAELQWR